MAVSGFLTLVSSRRTRICTNAVRRLGRPSGASVMVGVFVRLRADWAAEITNRIHLFGNDELANEWIKQTLVGFGVITGNDRSGYMFDDYSASSFADALGEYQCGLDSFERFHLFPCDCHGGVPLVDFGV